MNSWFESEKSKAEFRVVYVREAHASDANQVPINRRQGVLVATHKSHEDRIRAAKKLQSDIGLKVPIVVDNMKDEIERAYSGFPDRIYIVGSNGRIAYKGAPGPRGFNVEEAQGALTRILANYRAASITRIAAW